MMCTPRQRGAYHAKDKCGSNLPHPSNPITDYCPHCLNGGTVATVKQNLPPGGWKEYNPITDASTLKRAGLCGDPRGKNDHMIGGKFMKYDKVPIVSKWKSGSVVDLQIEVDTNHNGYFEFILCNLDVCGVPDISEKCFKEHCYRLQRVRARKCESPSQGTHFQCGPIDAKYPSRFYVPCRKTGHVGVHLVGGDGTMLYKLPDGVSCVHCVLQWYWATGNSCAPRGFLDYFERYDNPFGTTCDSDGGGTGAHRKGMGSCGGQVVPEEFWSCADVSITGSGKRKPPRAGNSKPFTAEAEAIQKPKDIPAFSTKKPKPVEPQSGTTRKPASQSMKSNRPQKEDVSMTPKPKTPRKGRPKRRPARKRCIREHSVCNGKVPCCGSEHVCVYKKSKSRFMCEIWWKLWSEVKDAGTDRAVIMEEEELFDLNNDDFDDGEYHLGQDESEELDEYDAYDKEL
ncbi:Cellulose/chitin-binding protein [Gracilaria domingensis]|nr:Cellulose/chitin-binding protein [Gracilaria domingensis]